MKTITLDQIMEKKPCEDYTRKSIAKWFPGKRPRLRKLFDVALENGVTHSDLIYHFVKYLDKKSYVYFACDCAERALKLVDCKDNRSWEAIRIARLYAQGKVTKEEMSAAAYVAYVAYVAHDADDAADAAAYYAAYAAYYAASASASAADADAAAYAAFAADAADAAADAAFAAAAADAERNWQLTRLIKYLEDL